MASERLMQFRLGAVALSTVLVTAALVVLFGRMPEWFQNTYPVYATFSDAAGVSRDTPVRKFGIGIGRVTDVGFDADGRNARIEIAIDAKVRLRRDETFSIRRGMLGDAVIEVVRK